MSKIKDDVKKQIEKRRTFAIISHPDAGKTTLTEKFLLYGELSTTSKNLSTSLILDTFMLISPFKLYAFLINITVQHFHSYIYFALIIP